MKRKLKCGGSKKKTVPRDGLFHERPLSAEVLRSAERAFYYFWLKPGSDTGFQEEVPRLASRVSGLCPENPQPLKRLAKLSIRGAVV